MLLLAAFSGGAWAEEPVIAEINRGLSVDDALWKECPVGDYVADALRQQTGAQAALIPSGLLKNALVGDLSVTEQDVTDLLYRDEAVYVYGLTVPQLKSLLEDSVSRWQLTEKETLDPEASAYEGFLQISGITMTADATAPVGDRVIGLKLDGEPLDLTDETATVTVALPESMAPEAEGRKAEQSMNAMLRDYIVSQGVVTLEDTDRIKVIGAHARDIISVIPSWFFGILLVILVANAFITGSRKERYDM